MKSLNILAMAALVISVTFNISCGKSDFKVDDKANAQETGDGNVDTDIGDDDNTTTDIDPNDPNNTNNPNNVPTGPFQVDPSINSGGNVFVQNVPQANQIYVTNNVVRFSQPVISFQSYEYQLVPTVSTFSFPNFVTIYDNGYGQQVRVMGSIVNNVINCNVVTFDTTIVGAQMVPVSTLVYRRW